MKNSKIFLINGIILTATALIMRSIGIIFNVYISNKIGSETVGVFSLVMSVYLFFVTIATSGLNLASTRIVSEEFASKNMTSSLKAMKSCIIFSLFLGISTSLLIFFASGFISSTCLRNEVSTTCLYYIMIGIPFISMSSVLNGYFSAVRKAYKSAISQCFELGIKMLVTVILLSNCMQFDIESICLVLILGDVISEVLSFIFLYVLYIFDRKKYYLTRSYSMGYKRRIVKTAFPVSATSCIRSGLSTIKQFLIPLKLEASGLPYSMAISNYGMITGMVMPVITFPCVFIASFSNLLIPEFSGLLAKGNSKRITTLCDKIFSITSIFSICVTAIFFFFSNEFAIAIYQNLESAIWIKSISILIFFMYVDNILDNMLKGLNKQFWVMLCNIFDLIITIVCIYFLVPILGLKGYVVVIFISEIFNFSVSIFQLRKVTKFKFKVSSWVIFPIISAFFSYQFSLLFNFTFSSSLVLNLACKITSFVIIYLLIMTLFTKIKKAVI